MNFKKRVNGSWTDTPHYIHKTDTDTITTLPAVLYPNDTTATVGLKGNMQQSGTPTSTTPIQPSECGDRTGNLWDGDIDTDNVILNQNGSPIPNDNYALSEYLPVLPSTSYVYHFYHNSAENRSTYTISLYDSSKNVITPMDLQWITENRDYDITFTTTSNTAYIRINWKKAYDENMMLIKGNIPLPYEPYGVKIPISSASTTTPVYLGEVESTRQIKKYEFTGTETISSNTLGVSGVGFTLRKSDMLSNGRKNGFCSHFVSQNSPNGSALDGISFGASDNVIYVTFSVQSASDYNLTDITSIKAWLAQQYAAGTPVTVWYILATEETGIVNEPLMRIGDYADTLSNVSIPVTAGGDTLSVGTTVQPSEVTVNYKGWHPVQNVHERDNGAWT